MMRNVAAVEIRKGDKFRSGMVFDTSWSETSRTVYVHVYWKLPRSTKTGVYPFKATDRLDIDRTPDQYERKCGV